MEEYHTGTVHHASLGQQHAVQEETRGHWDAIHIPQETSIAVLPGETAPFPHLPGLTGRPARGTYFTILHPATQLACTQDAMWWLRIVPARPRALAPRRRLRFPRTTVARPDFADGVKQYFHRWETGIAEDNAICEAQQAGLASALRRPGPVRAPRARRPPASTTGCWTRCSTARGAGARCAICDPAPAPKPTALVAAALEEGREGLLKRVC